MSTSYILDSLNDEDLKSMEGKIDALCKRKTSKVGGGLIFVYISGSALRPLERAYYTNNSI